MFRAAFRKAVAYGRLRELRRVSSPGLSRDGCCVSRSLSGSGHSSGTFWRAASASGRGQRPGDQGDRVARRERAERAKALDSAAATRLGSGAQPTFKP